jgi:hypothetical protein
MFCDYKIFSIFVIVKKINGCYFEITIERIKVIVSTGFGGIQGSIRVNTFLYAV